MSEALHVGCKDGGNQPLSRVWIWQNLIMGLLWRMAKQKGPRSFNKDALSSSYRQASMRMSEDTETKVLAKHADEDDAWVLV